MRHRTTTLLLVWTVLAVPATAQFDMGGGSVGGDYGPNDGKIRLAVIPIPNYSPSLGWGLGLAGTAFYKLSRQDLVSPPSSTSLFGFGAENETWAAGFAQQLYLDEDRWRALFALGRIDFNFQFNTQSYLPSLPGLWIDYNSRNDFGLLEAQRRLGERRIFVGLTGLYLSTRVLFGDDGSPIPEEARQTDEDYHGLGPLLAFDSRDHVFSPRAGHHVELRWRNHGRWLGAQRDYNSWELKAASYAALGDTSRILATRLTAAIAAGDVPFTGQNLVGQRNLRGYTDGRHRADQVTTLETEFRWWPWRRWGLAAFAGVGWAVDEIRELSLAGALPAAGLGIRYLMIEAYRISARVDYARGKQDEGWYFAIGEAF